MEAPVNPFTNDPNNPFTILKREREAREDGEQWYSDREQTQKKWDYEN